jgi:hypothetical protein
MNITFCDICGEEVVRGIQPNFMWKFGDESTPINMCSDCIKETSLFLRGRQSKLGVNSISFDVNPKEKVEPKTKEDQSGNK